MVPPTESLRFVAGELGRCGRNLEEIGAKFLGPNRFKVFLKNIAKRLSTSSRFRAYWKIGSEFVLVLNGPKKRIFGPISEKKPFSDNIF